MSTPLFRFENIRKTLATGRRVLDVEDLSIYAKHCLLLTGSNGAGKTTLLKILSGLEQPDEDTKDVRRNTIVHYEHLHLPWTAARRQVCRDVIYLHQQAYLFDNSVFENVRYGLRRRGLRREEITKRIHPALEWAGLSHLAQRNARELSGGEKQRVALTRAMVLRPRVLLLDEPFSGLDENARHRTGLLIKRIRAEGVAIVVTSHELQPVAGIADSHLELCDGRLGTPVVPLHRGKKNARPQSLNLSPSTAFLNARFEDEIC
jgi:tungstate transport system ATP-binding protein